MADAVDDGSEQLLVLRMVWDDHRPYLRVRRSPKAASQLVPVEGLPLSYQLDDDPVRTCVGHVPFRKELGSFHDCHRRPDPGARTCRQCSIVEATFASNLHHAHTKGSAELDPSVNEHMNQPNRLYLAGFRDGSIKIGTSTLNRSDRRLEEQGAWMARFVAETTNGRMVRHIEDAVTEIMGTPQAISAVRKRRGLVAPVSDVSLQAALDHATSEVHRIIVASGGEQTERLDISWRHPMADHPAIAGAIDYPLSVKQGRHDLQFITAIGRHILARRPGGDDVFVVDPAPLYGLWLDLGDYGSDEIAIQDSLF